MVLEFANGRVERADIVVGADGVRSTTRRWVTGADDAVYSGTSAFRGIVPTENLPSLPDPHAIQFWMGPDAHLLHYAIGGNGESVNFFAVVETPKIWLHPSTVAEVHEELPVASFRGWHPAVTEMIKAAASPISWALFTVRPLLQWYRGRVVILGDAAHGMLPHHGQGANTSIEDAFALAALLAERHRRPENTFSRFQTLRRTRTRKIQRSSRVTSSLLHLPDGPTAEARNAKVARVADDFGWIHEYDVQQELQKIGVRSRDVPGRYQVDTGGTRHVQNEVLGDIATILASVAGVDPARGDAREVLRRRLDIDSMTMLEVIVALEDRFGLLIPDDEWSRFSTVGDLVGHLEQAGVGAPS